MGKNKMKTGWHYKEQDLPIGTEDKEALLTILKNFIDNIENTIEYQFNMYTETEEFQESSSKWKEFRPVGGSMHLSVSARLDIPVAKAEDAKNADNWKISVGDVNPDEFEWKEIKFPGVGLTQEEAKELERLLKKCSCG